MGFRSLYRDCEVENLLLKVEQRKVFGFRGRIMPQFAMTMVT
jgi:hypothetical protein